MCGKETGILAILSLGELGLTVYRKCFGAGEILNLKGKGQVSPLVMGYSNFILFIKFNGLLNISIPINQSIDIPFTNTFKVQYIRSME